MNKFQQWVNKHKPAESKREVEEIQLTPEEELAIAWERWKEAWRIPILLFKVIGVFITVLLFMWAVTVVEIQNECYLDKECREWIER